MPFQNDFLFREIFFTIFCMLCAFCSGGQNQASSLEKPGGRGISTRSSLNNWNTNFVMRAIACVALRLKQFESENSDAISAVLSIPVSSSGKVRARTPFADNGFFLRNLSLKKCLMLG